MRHAHDRRQPDADVACPLEDNGHDFVTHDRRHQADRRLENLDMEERQTLLSEMPWLTFYKLV